MAVLTDSENPQTYWRVLKIRLKKEGIQTVTNCNALKLRAADGKMRLADEADTEQLFRIIQSIPSPKAEAIKQWIAHVASEPKKKIMNLQFAICNFSGVDNWLWGSDNDEPLLLGSDTAIGGISVEEKAESQRSHSGGRSELVLRKLKKKLRIKVTVVPLKIIGRNMAFMD